MSQRFVSLQIGFFWKAFTTQITFVWFNPYNHVVQIEESESIIEQVTKEKGKPELYWAAWVENITERKPQQGTGARVVDNRKYLVQILEQSSV